MNTLKKKVTLNNLFTEYAKILNGVLQLSDRELEVFAFLLKADYDGPAYVNNHINSKEVRKRFISSTGVSEANYSRYLGTIKKKGLIVKSQSGKWVLNDIIRPVINNGVFELKFELDVISGDTNKGPSSKV